MSSLGALVGLGLVGLGSGWGDAVAGLAVTLFILHVGWEVSRDLARQLMDGVDPENLQAARHPAEQVHGVTVLDVRGRWMGRSLLLEIEVATDASQPLAAATQLSRRVEQAVLDSVPAARLVRCTPSFAAETKSERR